MTKAYTNSLIHESSPYLLQHAHNPVNWLPWGDDALQKAKNENKLIILSVGYAACHWCHVMERESFEDIETATLMNKHFVNIKVDREERPDIDQVYMEAVQLMTGQGGWPLNCILSPDGRPVYGGTYFRKADWQHILESLQTTFEREPRRIEEFARKMQLGLNQQNELAPKKVKDQLKKEDISKAVERWKKSFDHIHGGDGKAPKFPMPNALAFLQQYIQLTNDQEVEKQLDLTLTKMAMGGIYDQLGGGFARYAVDTIWKVPHFEKMLYDNGQLISLYADAYKRNPNSLYKNIIEESISFVKRELTGEEGNFYSSLDADSEGVEGKYYVWEENEFDRLLSEDAQLFKSYFGIGSEGKWEEGNICIVSKQIDDFCNEHNEDPASFQLKLKEVKKKLLAHRTKRIAPARDDKTLTAWNALMIKGLLDAYLALENASYLHLALRNAEFLKSNMIHEDGKVFRNYKDGKVSIPGFLDDYSIVAEAFVLLFECSLDENWLHLSHKIIRYTLEHFYDEASGMFYYTSDLDEPLIQRKRELSDNVIPSSNSVMAKILYKLSVFLDEPKFEEMARQMLSLTFEASISHGRFYANWLSLMSWFAYGTKELVITGKDAKKNLLQIRKRYLPNVFVLGSEEQSDLSIFRNRHQAGKTLIYMCENKTCKVPVENIQDIGL